MIDPLSVKEMLSRMAALATEVAKLNKDIMAVLKPRKPTDAKQWEQHCSSTWAEELKSFAEGSSKKRGVEASFAKSCVEVHKEQYDQFMAELKQKKADAAAAKKASKKPKAAAKSKKVAESVAESESESVAESVESVAESVAESESESVAEVATVATVATVVESKPKSKRSKKAATATTESESATESATEAKPKRQRKSKAKTEAATEAATVTAATESATATTESATETAVVESESKVTKTIVTREAKPKTKRSKKAEAVVAEAVVAEVAESEAESESAESESKVTIVTIVTPVSMSLPPVPTRSSNSASFDKPVKFKCPANKKSYMKNSTGHLWKLGETVDEVGDYVGFYNEDEQTIDFYSGGDKPETPVW